MIRARLASQGFTLPAAIGQGDIGIAAAYATFPCIERYRSCGQVSSLVTFVVGQHSFRYADGGMVSVVVLRSPFLACRRWGSQSFSSRFRQNGIATQQHAIDLMNLFLFFLLFSNLFFQPSSGAERGTGNGRRSLVTISM